MKAQPGAEKDICSVLRRHYGARTVLGVAIPILDEHISRVKAGETPRGLSEKEIIEGFRQLANEFLHSDYHSTYILRPLGKGGFLDFDNDRYFMRPSLIENTAIDQIEQLRIDLLDSLRSAYEQRQAAIRKLDETCALPPERLEERSSLVKEYLSQLTGNRGEMFEVVSFAVLREYFRTFGFSLQRFSTTHANDGGMDFVASDAIYQVTTDESVEKLRRDLRKAPGTKRVLVRPTVTEDILGLGEDRVLEIIELKDLLGHFIVWLLGRDTRSRRSHHLQRILLVALDEFRREDKAEMADKQARKAPQ
jgi:hypothetical protein